MNSILRAVLLVAADCCTILIHAESTETFDYDWPNYANDPGSSKYADLDQINKDTVSALHTVWTWDSPDNAHIKANGKHVPAGFKSTPIKIGAVLYISTPLGFVAAIDAITGKQKWVFDTNPISTLHALYTVRNRGPWGPLFLFSNHLTFW